MSIVHVVHFVHQTRHLGMKHTEYSYNTPQDNRQSSPTTVYSRYIAVVCIAELDISRSHVGPHFLAHLIREFCRRGAQEHDIFREFAVTPCIQFGGDNFSRNLLTAKAFVPIRRSQLFAKSTRAYLSMRAGTHGVGWAAMLGGALTPPLCRRVGSS